MEIGEKLQLTIEDLSSDGNGIARRNDGYVFFVPFALPGEEVTATVSRLKKNYGIASLDTIKTESPERVSPPCKWFGQCGGCQLQHCSYKHQLELKRHFVLNALERVARILPRREVQNCVASPLIWNYRNKASFPVRKDQQEISTGFFKKGSHEIVPVDKCLINDQDIDGLYRQVRNSLEDTGLHAYSEQYHTGMLRHIIFRKGLSTSQLLFSAVVKKAANRKQLKRLRFFAHELKKSNSQLVGVTLNINSARGNVIVGRDTLVLQGREWINEKICNLDFHYDTTAFFQVNPLQAEQLFSYVCKEALNDQGHNVLELYSGVGVLTAMLARKATKVTAVEEWPSSVESLRENLSLNSITNVEVIQGRVEDLTGRLRGEDHEVIVIDPPRSGCTEPVLNFMKEFQPLRIIYVSCNPATLARDIAALCENGIYCLDKVNTFDMFPQTVHVESVATLVRS